MDAAAPGLGLAFLAGLASFLSPCVFALVPAYVGYLGGRTAAASATRKDSIAWTSFRHGLAFVLGFSIVFVLLGLISSAIGSVLYDFSWLLAKLGGVVVIVFGLHLTGVVRIRFLDLDLRPRAKIDRRRGYLSSVLMGVFFSAGWSPCVGPILGVILTFAINEASLTQGALLLSAYSAGLAIPFLLAATQIGWVDFLLRRHAKLSHYVERGMGFVLIAVGLLLFSGRFSTLGTLGFFFEYSDELVVGRYLVAAMLSSLTLGLLPAVWARRRGRSFTEWWLLGSGLIFVVLAIFAMLMG